MALQKADATFTLLRRQVSQIFRIIIPAGFTGAKGLSGLNRFVCLSFRFSLFIFFFSR